MDIKRFEASGGDMVAPGGIPFTRDTMELRKVNPGVSEQEAIAALQKNALDEVLFRGDDGDLYLVAADQLERTGMKFGLPEKGERVNAGGVEGEVLHADNERDYMQAVTAVGVGAAGAAPLAGVYYGLHMIGAYGGGITGVLAGLVSVPLNALKGAAVTFGAGTAGAAVPNVYNIFNTEKSFAALDAISTRLDGE